MLRSRGSFRVLLPTLLFTLLPFIIACGAQETPDENLPGDAAFGNLQETEAGAALAAALAEAEETDRQVFVHTGADW